MSQSHLFDRRELDIEKHHLSCAILHTSVSLLASGLENFVEDTLTSKRKKSSEDIFACCYVAVISFWEPAIKDSLLLLIDRCVQTSHPRSVLERVGGSAFTTPSIDTAKTYMSPAIHVCKGETGRQISSHRNREVERGTVIMHEEPFLATVVAECGCHEGPLLVEHLTMAYAFAEQFTKAPEEILIQRKLWRFLHSIQSGLSTNIEEDRSQSTSCVEGKEEEKERSSVRRCILSSMFNRNYTDNADDDDDDDDDDHDDYIVMGSDHSTERKSTSASSSIDHNHDTGSNSKSSKDDEELTIAQWSFHTQCVMACTAIISHLYSDSINNNEDMNKKSHNGMRTRFSTKNKSYESSLVFFLIIARLPQNVHAISRVRTVSTVRSTPSDCTTSRKNKIDKNNFIKRHDENDGRGEMEEEIIQERAGFGLFLCASAINHSCAPNCTVRFEFDSSSNLTAATSDHVRLRKKNVIDTMDRNTITSWERMTDTNNEELKNNLRQIENVRLELVCTQSVSSNSQCFISYGPLASRQARKARKVLLEEQYLFECSCSACVCIGEMKTSFSKNDNKSYTKNEDNNAGLHKNETSNQNKNGAKNVTSGKPSTVIDNDSDNAILEKLNKVNETLILLRELADKADTMFNIIQSDKSCKGEHRIDKLATCDLLHLQIPREMLVSIDFEHFSGDLEEMLVASCRNSQNADKVTKKESCESNHKKNVTNGLQERLVKYQNIVRCMYAEHCRIFCKVFDMSAYISSVLGYNIKTREFLLQIIQKMTCRKSMECYADDDVIVGRERVKLAQVLYCLGDGAECMTVLLVAESNLGPFVARSDPDLKEITRLKKLLSDSRY